MSKLENLVPPVELCKLIPAGEFEDSFAMWVVKWSNAEINGERVVTITGVIPKGTIIELPQHPTDEQIDLLARRFPGAIVCKEHYPAPTLQEILDELEQFTVSCFSKGHQTEVANGWNCISDDTATTAALKLWLKQKGIEDA